MAGSDIGNEHNKRCVYDAWEEFLVYGRSIELSVSAYRRRSKLINSVFHVLSS